MAKLESQIEKASKMCRLAVKDKNKKDTDTIGTAIC